MATFLVFDTETTGLPSSYSMVSPKTLQNWDSCRMVQIAWIIYKDTELVKKECYTIKPNGFTISESSTNIHGITNEFANINGHNITDILVKFFTDIKDNNVDTIVAHNLSFDKNVINSEVFRCKDTIGESYKIWNKQKFFCTMKSLTRKGQKWPKLAELYKQICGGEPQGTLHTADADAQICADIYLKVKDK